MKNAVTSTSHEQPDMFSIMMSLLTFAKHEKLAKNFNIFPLLLLLNAVRPFITSNWL